MKPSASEDLFGRSAALIICLFAVGAFAGSKLCAASGLIDKGQDKNGAALTAFGKNSAAPSLATLESFKSRRYDTGVLIQWSTGFEIDNLGFRLYRVQFGKHTLITPQILAGSALVTAHGTPLTAGKSYAWWDDEITSCGSPVGDCPNPQYALEELDVKGRSIWRGPIETQTVGGPPPAQAQAAQLAGLGASDSPSRPVQRWAKPAKISVGMSASPFALASQLAIKISVNQEAWYRVTQQELLAAGLDPKTDPRNLQLYVDNQPQAILVTGESDGSLDASDTVEFYGVGLDSPHSDTRVYWLAGGATPGLRIATESSPAPPTTGGNFPFFVERRDRTIYYSGLLNGDNENFFGAVIVSQPVNQTLTVPNLDPTATGATLEVALQGVSFVTHQINVALNGSSIGSVGFFGQASGLASLSVPPGVLQQGVNQVTLTAAGGGDVSLVDHLRLTYNHTYFANNDVLKLTASANQQLTIDGFSANTIRVFDVTNPATVQEVTGQVQQQGANYSISLFAPGTGSRTLLALAGGQISAANKVAANLPSSWSKAGNGADLLIITPRAFFSALQPLRTARLAQGLAVTIVDIEDVYDEFSFGHKTPQAIKDFLAFAHNVWKKKALYALFVGDASYDTKNYLGFGDLNLVPTKLIDTDFMEACSDDWLADFDGDGLPDLSLGRVPTRTAGATAQVVSKILSYDSAHRPDEMLLVADSNDEYNFEAASAALHGLGPYGVKHVDLNRGQIADPAVAKATLLDSITRGQRFVNYVGHGNVDQWHGNLLTNADAESLVNRDYFPVFLMMTCLNGYFNDPSLDCIAEKLLMNPNGGAAAVWTSTGQTLPSGQWDINQEMYRQMFSAPQVRIGDAARAAKAVTTDLDVRRTWILLGDPTMRVR